MTSTVACDETGNGWIAWWIPATRNGQNGVVSYAPITNAAKRPFSFLAAP